MTLRLILVDLIYPSASNVQLQVIPLWADDGIKVKVEIYSVELVITLECFDA